MGWSPLTWKWPTSYGVGVQCVSCCFVSLLVFRLVRSIP